MKKILQEEVDKTLKEVFGFSDFRPGQREIVDAILMGRNVLAVMPTGAGKSLCYQLPAVRSQKKSVIISPLVALIDDQTASLSQLDVNATKLHSGLSRDENIINGDVLLLANRTFYF